MPRVARVQPGGVIFHVLNRGNNRAKIFSKHGDYAAFEAILAETLQRVPLRLLAYCVMPSHWHLVLWPRRDGELGRFMQRLTTTHARRWRGNRGSVGEGHLYQGTYKSFPVQSDEHMLTICRYVERNALRAGLVKRAEAWRWSSLWRRRNPRVTDNVPPLADWPVEPPRDWLTRVNRPETDAELAEVQMSMRRGRPFGDEDWQRGTAIRLSLTHTFRSRGRPSKRLEGEEK